MNIKDDLKAEAIALGFSFLSITDCSPARSYPVFSDWLACDHHAGMAYLASERSREIRQQPSRLADGCRSILVVGLPYLMMPPGTIHDLPGLTGRVAAYACAQDYHAVIPELLNKLMKVFARFGFPTQDAKLFTDSEPILERDLAQRAGAGWIGRNTCLIRPGEGSYFLLGEVFTDIELEPDPPFLNDRCGSCQRCIQACPTGCILPNRTIDTNRCISYLTIENRECIPIDLRPMIGDWVFGCDVCQQVCPWNRFAPTEAVNSPLGFVPEMASPNLLADMRLLPEEFQALYGNTHISRAKYRGYLRNITVALGNSHDPAAIPDLVIVMESNQDKLIRAHAAWALGTIGTHAAKVRLETRLSAETNSAVSEEIRLALDHFNE